MKLKHLALGLVLLAASSARAQFPNTYNTTFSVSWGPGTKIDPKYGKSPGVVFVTEYWHGSTNNGSTMNNSGAHHTPHSYVKMGTKTELLRVGPMYTPGQTMTWATTYGEELMDMGCTFDVLNTGGCTVDTQPQISCTVIGPFYLPPKYIQIGFGKTFSQPINRGTSPNRDGYFIWDTKTNCLNTPDFPGPDILYEGVDEAMGTYPNINYIFTIAFGWRWQLVGLSAKGVPWTWNNLPRQGYNPYVDMETWNEGPTACTNHDLGIFPD